MCILLNICTFCIVSRADQDGFVCSRLAAVKRKLAELNTLVDTIQQSSAHIHGMETFSAPHVVDHDSKPKTKQLPNAATVRSEAHAQHETTSRKEIEREQRWERLVMCLCV